MYGAASLLLFALLSPPAVVEPLAAVRASAQEADVDALRTIADGPRTGAGGFAQAVLVPLLHARGEADEAAQRARLAGFLTRWQVIGPLPGGARALDGPQTARDDWRVGATAEGYAGRGHAVRWHGVGDAARYGRLDLDAVSHHADGGVLLAAAIFGLEIGETVAIRVTSAASWRLWLDGERVDAGPGRPSLRGADAVLATLRPGPHRLLVETHG
ncbi:MAG: hypothetical protein KC620_17630, partial [Myxococcales bacterium]|nr:hypothetical protein [Myxococcales bacterium]